MAKKKNDSAIDLPEIRIQNVSKLLHEQITNIAKNSGVSVQSFLKPKLREIADSYPDKMKEKPLDY